MKFCLLSTENNDFKYVLTKPAMILTPFPPKCVKIFKKVIYLPGQSYYSTVEAPL
jgi:hypothetical protein